LRRVSFNNDAELQNWLDEFFTAKSKDFLSVGSKTCPNVGSQSWIMEANTYLIYSLIIWVKHKLFVSVKKPHERMYRR
jgi:hypothetical protein